jgi:hypothetical protein
VNVFWDEIPFTPKNSALFQTGIVMCTKTSTSDMERGNSSAKTLLHRHTQGDFGDIPEQDWVQNVKNIEEKGGAVFSVFWMSRGKCVWIYTESDRSRTLIVTPNEGL